MNYDLQLARGEDGSSYNLAVGEPWFLHDELLFAHGNPPIDHLGYPSMRGEPPLLKELKAHFPGHQVVVTNGAKHAISAAIYALSKSDRPKHARSGTLWHKPPYWPSFPTLAELSGLSWQSDSEFGPVDLSIETWPNNPSGSCLEFRNDVNIWDAAYAHDVYGWNGKAPKYDILVQGAAKIFGVPGLRVGWLATENKELAKAAAFYVEATTSGVCVTAQRQVAAIFNYVDKNPDIAKNAYGKARTTLLRNGELFLNHLEPYVEQIYGVPGYGSGMFAWFRVKPEYSGIFVAAMKRVQLKLVSGVACGMSEPDWYRMSMGHRNQYTSSALKDMAKALHDTKP